MKRIIKYLIIFWISFFTLISFMGITRYAVLNSPIIKGSSKDIIIFLSTLMVNIGKFQSIRKPMIFESNLPQKNGFTYSRKYNGSKDYLLISTWDNSINQAIVKLVRIEDAKIIHKWIPDINIIVNKFDSSNRYVVRTRLEKNATALSHPFMMNDGSIIFNAGGIFKVDKNSNLVWFNTTPSHHSIEQDFDGNFWICGYNSSNRNADKFQIMDDAVQKISSINGSVLFEKSVFEILMENGYNRGLFFINPQNTSTSTHLDYMHLNDVQPILFDSKYWKKGDLLLSLRHQNLLLLYRPSINKIIWRQNGPWLRQHDVDVIDSTHIGVLGNNVLDAQFENDDLKLLDGHSNEYIYDFSNNSISTPYDSLFKSSNIGAFTGGQTRVLENEDIIIEDPNLCRIIYGTKTDEIWTYLERIDKQKVACFNWCRYITEAEFKKLTFINPKDTIQ